MLRIGAMNMMLHGVENPNISYRDSLSGENKDKEEYSLVLANPPFKGSLDAEAVSAKARSPRPDRSPNSCHIVPFQMNSFDP